FDGCGDNAGPAGGVATVEDRAVEVAAFRGVVDVALHAFEVGLPCQVLVDVGCLDGVDFVDHGIADSFVCRTGAFDVVPDLVKRNVDGVTVVGDDVGHVVLAAAGHRHVGGVA